MLKISSASDFAIYLAYHMAQTSSSHRGIGCHWALAPEGTSNVSQDINRTRKGQANVELNSAAAADDDIVDDDILI